MEREMKFAVRNPLSVIVIGDLFYVEVNYITITFLILLFLIRVVPNDLESYLII